MEQVQEQILELESEKAAKSHGKQKTQKSKKSTRLVDPL